MSIIIFFGIALFIFLVGVVVIVVTVRQWRLERKSNQALLKATQSNQN